MRARDIPWGVCVSVLMAGCCTETGIYYRGKAPENINIIAHDRHALSITIKSPITNAASIAVTDADCTLSDQKRRSYGLKFQPSGSRSDSNLMLSWYDVTAYGPLPSAARYEFRNGPYDISIAFTEQGRRQVVEVPFEFHRSSVPYPIIWIGWWIYRPTSP